MMPDDALASEGKWFPHEGATEFKVSYMETPRYEKKLNRLMFAARKGGTRITGGPSNALIAEAMFKTILHDWKGLTENGKPFEFNLQNCIKFLSKSKEAREFVQGASATLENFQTEEQKKSASEGRSEDSEEEGEEHTSAEADLKSGAPVATPVGG